MRRCHGYKSRGLISSLPSFGRGKALSVLGSGVWVRKRVFTTRSRRMVCLFFFALLRDGHNGFVFDFLFYAGYEGFYCMPGVRGVVIRVIHTEPLGNGSAQRLVARRKRDFSPDSMLCSC